MKHVARVIARELSEPITCWITAEAGLLSQLIEYLIELPLELVQRLRIVCKDFKAEVSKFMLGSLNELCVLQNLGLFQAPQLKASPSLVSALALVAPRKVG